MAGLSWYGDAVNRIVTAGAVRGLNQAAAFAHSVAVPRTPIEMGDLRGSLQIEPASVANPQAAIHTNLPYAVAQHERMDYAHPRGGQAKYLESAVNDSRQQMLRIISSEARKA